MKRGKIELWKPIYIIDIFVCIIYVLQFFIHKEEYHLVWALLLACVVYVSRPYTFKEKENRAN